MWRRMGLARSDFSEERVSTIFRVEKIYERKKALVVESVSRLLMLSFAREFFYPEDRGNTFL
jgi:hypothetical protein